MLNRREFLSWTLAAGGMTALPPARAEDKWGASRGYPSGLAGGLERDPTYRVGNYSGGFEAAFPHNIIRASDSPRKLTSNPQSISYRWGGATKSPEEYMDSRPLTGLLICKGEDIVFEGYRMGRNPSMRMSGWSMSKSVTSLLLGICIDRGLVRSLDDTADQYVPELKGTLHGSTTLRNLVNMSSGANVVHGETDNGRIYVSAFYLQWSSIGRTVAAWNVRKEEQGVRFNYNELCPLTVGMVIRAVTQSSMSRFAESALWQPLGAEADATWLTNANRDEFNCIGFAARLRDWARLGLLVADHGRVGDRQIISEAWIHECTRWTSQEQHCTFGRATPRAGYKAFMWHTKRDGSRPAFVGHHGQMVLVDIPRRTVLVQTAVDHEGDWREELSALFQAAVDA